MHPKIEVSIDGQPVAGAFYKRLISISIADKAGLKSDTVDIERNDGPPSFLALPKTGVVIDVIADVDGDSDRLYRIPEPFASVRLRRHRSGVARCVTDQAGRMSSD